MLLDAQPGPVRCAVCHDELAELKHRCPGCGAELHADCHVALGGCPTIGCAHRAPVQGGIAHEKDAPRRYPVAAIGAGGALVALVMVGFFPRPGPHPSPSEPPAAPPVVRSRPVPARPPSPPPPPVAVRPRPLPTHHRFGDFSVTLWPLGSNDGTLSSPYAEVFGALGEPLAYFATGGALPLPAVHVRERAERGPGPDVDLLVIECSDAQGVVGGRQLYTLVPTEGRLALIRLEDAAGRLAQKSLFADRTVNVGPVPPLGSPAQWRDAVESVDEVEALEALQWLARYDNLGTTSVACARADPRVRRAIASRLRSPEPWIAEAAALALSVCERGRR